MSEMDIISTGFIAATAPEVPDHHVELASGDSVAIYDRDGDNRFDPGKDKIEVRMDGQVVSEDIARKGLRSLGITHLTAMKISAAVRYLRACDRIAKSGSPGELEKKIGRARRAAKRLGNAGTFERQANKARAFYAVSTLQWLEGASRCPEMQNPVRCEEVLAAAAALKSYAARHHLLGPEDMKRLDQIICSIRTQTTCGEPKRA